MKSVKICSNLLEPFVDEDCQKRLKHIKKECPPQYALLMSMKNDLNIIYNDLLKFQGFIAILEEDKSLYEKRIELKKQTHQDYSIDKAILERINFQLSLLN